MIVQMPSAITFMGAFLSRLYSCSTCCPVWIGQVPFAKSCDAVHVKCWSRIAYGARLAIEYLIGDRWLMACRTSLTFRLITPPKIVEIDSRIDVTLTANPTCEKSVQNMIPTDSPQLMMQKQLNALMRNIFGLRSRLSA